VQAWFLLSHVVESEQKQIAYLKKVVALDPGHEMAIQRLAQLEPPEPLPAVEEMVKVEAGEAWDDSLSDWMPEPAEELGLEAALSPPEPVVPTEEEPVLPAVDRLTVEPEPAAVAPVAVDSPVPSAATAAPKETKGQRQALMLTLGLVGLVAAATIVFIALLITIFSAF